MKKDNKVVVVYAASNDYVPYLGVSIFSLISHISPNKRYQIYVLHVDIDENNIKRLETLSKETINISVLNISSLTEKLYLKRSKHLTAEAFFRILTAEVLPGEERAVYLDCDTIILDDISKLYEIDLEDEYLAAVRHVKDLYLKNYVENILKQNSYSYFNSGVMVMNLEKFRQDQLGERCYGILQQDRTLTYLDQDILNIICAGKFKYLDDRWNVCWQFQRSHPIREDNQRFENSLEHPALIHYTSGLKPWKILQPGLAAYFWEYARCSIFYEEILFKNIEEFCRQKQYFDHYEFPFEKVPGGFKIVLYGAGGVGSAYWEQLKYTEYCKIVLWVDKNYKEKQSQYKEVQPIEALEGASYDYIIIAIEDRNRAEKIKQELEEKGVSSCKVIWKDPAKHLFVK